MQLAGPLPVLPTPFNEDQSIDLRSMLAIIDRLLAKDIKGITVLGSSSEAVFLSDVERASIMSTVLTHIEGRSATLVGIIRFDTHTAIEEAKRARDLGATGLMVALPQYYRIPLSEVIWHYAAIVKEVGLPVYYYHYPETTKLRLNPKQVAKLFAEVNLAGIKESGFSTPEMKAHMRHIRRPIQYFTGQSFNLLKSLQLGAVGAICPIGVLMPRTSQELVSSFCQKRFVEAARLQERLLLSLPLVIPGSVSAQVAGRALRASLRFGFRLPKPPGVPHAGIKEALFALGIIRSAAVRGPQPPLSEKRRMDIQRILQKIAEI